MFKHSVRVPRLYKIAAKIAKEVNEGIGSVKYLVYEYRKKHPNIKALYALVTTLFQRNSELECILKKSQFFTKEPRADHWLSKILIIELLWGTKRLSGGSTPETTVKSYEQIFKAHLSDISLVPTSVNDIKAKIKPRYVRINTLSVTLNEAVENFRSEGWNLCKFFDKGDYKGFLDKITHLDKKEFLIDIHVPDLLIFPPKTEFHQHLAYKNGSIVLQDKASCLPVHILNPPPDSIVLDMCAAPGMKTTQLAAVMNNQGTVYAVERNPKRFEILNKMIESLGASCVKTENKDVLTCTAADFPGVQYILVDPSCSGSGITDRLEFEQEKSLQRMEKLAGFQIKILRTALTRYPKVKKVIYSTCSIYPEENEDVVRQVLETNIYFKLVNAKQFVNDTWQNFGSSDYGDIGKYCLYAKPNEDFTNGFFVAVFERLEEGEENQFFNTKIYNYKKHIQSQERRKERREKEHHQNQQSNFTDNEKIIIGEGSSNIIKDEVTDIASAVSLKKKKKKDAKEKGEFKSENDENAVEHFYDGNEKGMKVIETEATKSNIFIKSTQICEKNKRKQNDLEISEEVDVEIVKYKKKKKTNKDKKVIGTTDENDITIEQIDYVKNERNKNENCDEGNETSLFHIGEESDIIEAANKKGRKRRHKGICNETEGEINVEIVKYKKKKKTEVAKEFIETTIEDNAALEQNKYLEDEKNRMENSNEDVEESGIIDVINKKKKKKRRKEGETINEEERKTESVTDQSAEKIKGRMKKKNKEISKDLVQINFENSHDKQKEKIENDNEEQQEIIFNENEEIAVVEVSKKSNKRKGKNEYISMDDDIFCEAKDIRKKKKRDKHKHSQMDKSGELDVETDKNKKRKKNPKRLQEFTEIFSERNYFVGDETYNHKDAGCIAKKTKKNKRTHNKRQKTANENTIETTLKRKKTKESKDNRNDEETFDNEMSALDTTDIVKKKKKRSTKLEVEVDTGNSGDMATNVVPIVDQKKHRV